jgi:hypothetical protein
MVRKLPANYLVGLVLLISVAIPLLGPAQQALAAGEKYLWTGQSINASQGGFVPAVNFSKVPSQDFVYKAVQTATNGGKVCTVGYQIKVSNLQKIGDSTAATISITAKDIGCPTTVTLGSISIVGAAPGEVDNDDLCTNTAGAMGWIICPMSNIIMEAAVSLDQGILTLLKIDTDAIFNPAGESGTPENQESSKAFFKAWGIFRNIAYAFLVIFGLVMVLSQILGLDIFDAYTIRKMLPKMVLAAVFIPLTWPLLKLFLIMANDSGEAVQQLIEGPFQEVGRTVTGGEVVTLAFLLFGGGGTAVVGVSSFLGVLGWGGVLALIGSGIVFVGSAFFILAAREMVAYALVVASALAVVSAITEFTNALYKFWWGLLLTVILSLPAVAAVLALSKVGATLAFLTNGVWGVIIAIIFIIAGYAMFWSLWKQLDKISGQLGNIVGKVTNTAQKNLNGIAMNSAKHRYQEGVEGRRSLGYFGVGNIATNLGRRFKFSNEAGLGAFGIGRHGRAVYQEAVRTMQHGVAEEMVKKDGDRAGGDDDSMRLLAQRGMDHGRFVREHAAMQMRDNPGLTEREATANAESALGRAQTSLGAHAGTNAMRIAAQKALLKSNTSYRRQWVQNPNTGAWQNQEMDFNQMNRQMYGDVASLVNDGLITVSDGAAMIKQNGARADRAGVGFGTVMTRLDDVARNGVVSLDAVNPAGISHVQAMADEALIGTGPGQLVGQRHEAVRLLAPEMLRRAREAGGRDNGQLGREFIEHVAAAASRQDLSGQLPELNASLNANNFMGQDIGPGTMQQWVEFMRGAPDPNSLIYQQVEARHLAQIKAQQGTTGAPATAAETATAQAATRAAIADAQRVFQEYRREYGAAWQQGGQQGGQPGGLPNPLAPVGGNPP